ncbi:hypothetical protein EV702DRAFT_1179551 [Suillus placidus]|uniref:Uncharacterized protein n=1 Tax=Suillus placidus TaxID=48579 RepID=A0A9P6ZVV3_9AGAM|nr:hypothetical protein EV702DRAFT_1179551 [Suillus placidus]
MAYPLAIIAKVLKVLGECSLVMASSLGPLFKKMDCCLCVNAFHGFAHNYRCQTKHHPLGIDGAGLEDFGTIEHIFSASNALASKYVNLATMIYNNYHQALQVISKESVALTEAMMSLGITKEDITLWRQEEVEYFHTLGQEPPWDVHAMAYVELLGSYALKLSQTRKLETQQRYATEKLDAVQLELVAMEVNMGITHRWEPSSPEYQASMKYMCTREYHRALDNLQHLVIQRLFELQRLNVAQTGMLDLLFVTVY